MEVAGANGGVRFLPEARKQPFRRVRSENILKLACSVVKRRSFCTFIIIAEHDGEESF